MASKTEKRNHSYFREKILKERLGIIFDCFEKGLDETCEIQSRLNNHHDNYYDGERIGKISVAKVKKVLNNLPNIIRIEEVNRYSKKDLKGVDLWIYVKRNEDDFSFEKFSVQVKSSKTGVRNFLSSHFGSPNFEEVLPQLKEKKWLLLMVGFQKNK